MNKTIATAAIVLLAFPMGAHAEGAAECRAPEELLSGAAYLRSLSLDLRGVVPEPEEYALVRGDGTIPDSLIDEWLDEPAFADQVVRFHDSLLWPNVSDVRLMSNRQRLIYTDGIWWRYLVAIHYRNVYQHCGDFEAEFEPDGSLIVHRTPNGGLQEGWVLVRPYWDPDTEIKVCAFEAQGHDAEKPQRISPMGTRCDGYDSRFDRYCGCGPNLAWCDTSRSPPTGDWAPVTWAMADDVRHRIRHVIDSDTIGEDSEANYLDLFYGRTMYVNGPLVHALKYMINAPAHVRLNDVPVDVDKLPDLEFTDFDEWRPVTLGDEQAGILTSPMYLMKFATKRGRTNRFYNAFLCQPFEPPPDGIDLDTGSETLDLTKRTGCKYCHSLLEPEAAHWGRWTEYGIGYMNPERFTPFRSDCTCVQDGRSCEADCSRYYITDPLSQAEESEWVGWLQSYEFRDEEEQLNIENGPKALVTRHVASGALPLCSARNAARWLLGREVRPNEDDWVSDLSGRFIRTDFNYKELVKAIVKSDQYRRVH